MERGSEPVAPTPHNNALQLTKPGASDGASQLNAVLDRPSEAE
jgi:hypothetical protein